MYVCGIEEIHGIVFLTLSKYIFGPAYQFVFFKVFFPIKGEFKNFLLCWMGTRLPEDYS